MSGVVSLTVDGAVATVRIDNEAKRNALSVPMWGQLRDAVADASRAEAVRVLVVRGAGRAAFCAGGDLDDLALLTSDEDARLAFLHSVEEALEAILDAPVPVLAMLHGATVGGGLAVASACDLRLADEELRMGIPAARIGIVPSRTEVDAIAGLIGPSRTADLFYTGRLLAADEALAWGLVNRVVPADELDDAVAALAGEIARAAPRATRATRRLLFGHLAGGHADVRPSADALSGPEFAETLRAMRERRPPVFPPAPRDGGRLAPAEVNGRPRRWFEDFHAGEDIALGELTLSREEIVRFARDWDPQPFHLDDEAARQGPFGELAASGLHVIALWGRMWIEGVLLGAAGLGGSGFEEVRFLRPARAERRLRAGARIVDTWPSETRPDRGTVLFEGTLVEDDGSPVLRIRGRSYIARRPDVDATA